MRHVFSLVARGWRSFLADPRPGQIATLASLLAYGLAFLEFDITLPQVVITLATALLTQRAADWWTDRDRTSGAKSALIFGLALCLLLRTDALSLAALGAALAVGSKFLLRVGGKHVFNPTNFAVVALMLASGGVWGSPGQWGPDRVLAVFPASAGLVVVNRAARSDVTFAFMATFAGLVVARSLWLVEPLSNPLHQVG